MMGSIIKIANSFINFSQYQKIRGG